MKLEMELRKYDAKTSLKKNPMIEIENILTDLQEGELDLLKKAGFEGAIESYEQVARMKDRYKSTSDIIKQYGKENIFKTSSIKKICSVYGLRFLPTAYYKGAVPAILGLKIKEFTQKVENGEDMLSKSFILGPKEVFNLKEIPKDPLYFIKLTSNNPGEEDLFYLVHQWGGEINALRKFINIPWRNGYTYNISCITILVSVFLIMNHFKLFAIETQGKYLIPYIILVFVIGLHGLANGLKCSNKANWNNEFE